MLLNPFVLRKLESRSARVSPRVRMPTTLRGSWGKNEPAIFVAIFSKTRRTSASSYCVRMSHANLLQIGGKNKFVHRDVSRARFYNRLHRMLTTKTQRHEGALVGARNSAVYA